MVFFICAWENGIVHSRDAGELRRHRAHHDVTVVIEFSSSHVGTSSFLILESDGIMILEGNKH